MITNKRIISLDYLRTRGMESTSVVKFVPLVGGVGLESNALVTGTDVMLKNLTAAQYRELLAGNAYLEFWIEAIDHTKPTTNNRLYPEQEFGLGMDRYLRRVLSNGGAQPGEHEHPPIKYDTKKSKEENMAKIADRLCRFNPDKITHYVVDTKTEGGVTYFKIRTNPSNTTIVKDISIGKVPTFSIRTLGDFPMVNGVNVAKNLLVITTDYVYNPANNKSRPIADSIKFVDPASVSTVNVNLVSKVGNESVDMFNLFEGETLMFGVESDGSVVFFAESEPKVKSQASITADVFASIF